MQRPDIAKYLSLPTTLSLQEEVGVAFRSAFLETCTPETKEIHRSLVDPRIGRGHPNPEGLGKAEELTRLARSGQTPVLFPSYGAYLEASNVGYAKNFGSDVYANTLSTEAAALSKKIADSYKGAAGAIVCPTGTNAIATALIAFPSKAIIMTENVFFPTTRFARKILNTEPTFIPGNASADFVAPVLDNVLAGRTPYKKRTMFSRLIEKVPFWRPVRLQPSDVTLCIEAPGNATFEISDIEGIAKLARNAGVRVMMNNTWATHAHFNPFDYGIPIIVQSLSKTLAGYGDTPGGAVIADNEEDLAKLKFALKATGVGAIAPGHCTRIFNRMDAAEQRLGESYGTALKLKEWFSRQEDIVEHILFPGSGDQTQQDRSTKYFGDKGNGLFSVVFKENVPKEKVIEFMDALALIRTSEGWGTHVSLTMLLNPNERHFNKWPKGQVLRFHAGSENVGDLLRDLEQAGTRVFGVRHGMREFVFDRSGLAPGLSLAV